MVTDVDGAVVAQFEFGPWGEVLTGSFDSFPGGMSFGFVGGLGVRTDATTGLLYMRARHYDPTLQRFISRDTLMADNRYAYAANSPQNLIDVTGREPATPTGGTEFGSSGIFRIKPSGGNPAIIHNNGGGNPWRKPTPKPKPICEELPWPIAWPEWEPVDYRWNPPPWNFGPVPDFTPPPPPIDLGLPEWGPIIPDPDHRGHAPTDTPTPKPTPTTTPTTTPSPVSTPFGQPDPVQAQFDEARSQQRAQNRAEGNHGPMPPGLRHPPRRPDWSVP